MRSFLGYFVTVVLITSLILVFYFLVVPQNGTNQKYLSPLPDFLTLGFNKQATLLDLWSPFIEKIQGSEKAIPDYTATSVLMYDLTTNKTLYEDDSTTQMPMASLTKIMTAIIALENKKSDDAYFVSGENLVGEDSMGLTSGEVLTQEELLYGLMLPSGNDASEVLASNYSGGRSAFIQAMNDKARALGLKETVFSNPSGLQGDGIQHTTASDLLVITRYALENFPLFAKIVSTYEHVIPASPMHKEFDLFNETNLLTTYPGVKGVKTGYTPEAGMCLVTLLDYQGHKIIGIVLNSENRREEMRNFLDYSLNQLNITPPAHQ
jgi:D-alanyl-D-alanine carboxypeptidase